MIQIQTREQHEGIKTMIEILDRRADKEELSSSGVQSLGVLIAMMGTIEALRKVARAAGPVWEIAEGEGKHLVPAFDRLFHALAALSNWLKEDD